MLLIVGILCLPILAVIDLIRVLRGGNTVDEEWSEMLEITKLNNKEDT